MFYFAYGSNMSLARIQDRLASAILCCRVYVTGHRLIFHKVGHDGSAKCDILKTSKAHDRVYGVLFIIAKQEKAVLDSYEGLGNGYEQKQVSVVFSSGTGVQAITYYATEIDASLQPYHWYKEHVLRGARENNLPAAYVQRIIMQNSVADPDNTRQLREMAIYR